MGLQPVQRAGGSQPATAQKIGVADPCRDGQGEGGLRDWVHSKICDPQYEGLPRTGDGCTFSQFYHPLNCGGHLLLVFLGAPKTAIYFPSL